MLERSNVPLIKTVTFITRVNEFTTKEMLIRVVKEADSPENFKSEIKWEITEVILR